MNLKSLAVAGATAALAVTAAAKPIPDEYKQNGFAVGCQAYTFNRFTVFEAIEKTAEAGGKIIEFYPGQKLSKFDSPTTWSHHASPEAIKQVQDKLKQHNIKAVNYGVVKGDDAAEWRKIFEFARTLDLYAVTTEDVEDLDIIEPLVKEFDIRLAIHEHPRKPDKPEYRVWDPHYILQVVKDRDPRIGACADTGHWQASGLSPVYCLRVLKGRIISSHLKDKRDYGSADCVPFGAGVGEVKRCLDELVKQRFEGNISIEYEHNWLENVPEVTRCVEFVRNYQSPQLE